MEEDLKKINGDIEILKIQRELIESKTWDDETHLERKYKMHENSFYSVINSVTNSVGTYIVNGLNSAGVFSVEDQKGEKLNFSIDRDLSKQRGTGKLVSFFYPNEKRDSRVLMFYSPTKGVAFEYSSNLLPNNVQLGKGDFFGKTIEGMIKNVASSTEGIKFSTNVERFKKSPNGLKHFYIVTDDFVEKEKQGDVISIISTLDGLVEGLHKNSSWKYGLNFIHEKEEPLFSIKITF